MKLTKDYKDLDLTVFIEGQIDTNTAPDLEKFVNCELSRAKNITLDFKEVSYVSSAGLRVLLALHKRQGERKADFVLVNVNSDINQILEMTGFSGFLTIK